MKQFYTILASSLIYCFLVSCAIEKEVVYKNVIKHQVEEGGTEIYDKVIVYKISSKKDSLCYYKEDKYLGATVIIVEKYFKPKLFND